jgi:hypothetical protein
MARVQEHKFVDLSKPLGPAKRPSDETRRSFIAKASGIAALTAMAPAAFARMPEIVANIAWGGSKRNRLFMAGSTSLYAVYVETRGGPIGG